MPDGRGEADAAPIAVYQRVGRPGLDRSAQGDALLDFDDTVTSGNFIFFAA